jgi:hypothetical protein
MTLVKHHTVMCDSCDAETDAHTPTAAEIRRIARVDGWTRPLLSSGYHIDLCPTCSAARRVETIERADSEGGR